MIDLLLSKAIVYNDKIELFLKYTDSPTEPIHPPDKKHNPDGTNDSDRVFLLTEYCYDYKRRVGKYTTIFETIKLTVSIYV